VNVTVPCEVCGKTVYRGRRYTWEDLGGYERQDEEGEYFDGCGACKVCGRSLCAECGNFDRDGVCAGCREEEKNDQL
jgi:hypothetical protein